MLLGLSQSQKKSPGLDAGDAPVEFLRNVRCDHVSINLSEQLNLRFRPGNTGSRFLAFCHLLAPTIKNLILDICTH